MDISSFVRFGTAETAADIDWEAVYISLLPKVFHYFAYRLGNQQLAEDLTASTFERAWHKRNKYRHDLGNFSSWVFGIARNVTREHFRKPQLEIELDKRNGLPSAHQTEGQLHQGGSVEQRWNDEAGIIAKWVYDGIYYELSSPNYPCLFPWLEAEDQYIVPEEDLLRMVDSMISQG